MLSRLLLAAASLVLATPAIAQDFDAVEIISQELAPGVAVLFGAGGNIGVSYGEDRTVIIDDQYAPLTGKIEAAIAKLGASPVEFVINTHWHGDHTGGNENFGSQGATILAHENVRLRMSTEQDRGEGRIVPPSPKEALPIVTYERGLTLHLNGDTIDIIAIGGGHTDGDSIIIWREKNIVHMGDLYFKIGGWPFIDVNSGGNIATALQSLDNALLMMDDATQVIPGHGPMSNKAELNGYRLMLGEAVNAVRHMKADGMAIDAVIAAAPLDRFKRGKGFIDEEAFIRAIWNDLD